MRASKNDDEMAAAAADFRRVANLPFFDGCAKPLYPAGLLIPLRR